MNAIVQPCFQNSINDDIQTHAGWHGFMSGLIAEKMLRGKTTPYLYILRGGEQERENETDYYLTFVRPDLTIFHQPFIVFVKPEGWYYEQGLVGGPFVNKAIDDVIHLIMHCTKEEAIPFTN